MVARARPKNQPLIVIVGETGSGKSELGMQLAERFNGEIVSADSWTVYKGFDIGTAKPTLSERAKVKHHLIDVVDASHGFNAALFKSLATQAIKDIQARNKLAILVGGTGLYVDSVVFDFSFLPAGDPLERRQLDQQKITDLLAEINTQGLGLEGIDIRNKRRLIRLIETGGQRPTNKQIRPNTFVVGLRIDREQLRDRITKRIDRMIIEGLEEEVRTLSKLYGWDVEPMKGIGYREWQAYFDGTQTLLQTKERIVSATMGLAKRQRTWFKRNSSIQWVDDPIAGQSLIETFLNNQE